MTKLEELKSAYAAACDAACAAVDARDAARYAARDAVEAARDALGAYDTELKKLQENTND